MRYNIGDKVTLPNGMTGIVTETNKWIDGNEQYEVKTGNGTKNISITEDGIVKLV